MEQIITIITTVYNRAGLMEKLYESLVKQKKKNFIWYVVDDGSEDNIEAVMKRLISQKKFPIEFFRKKNGGKHTALNVAFANLKTELALTVDSDDALIPEATEIIENVWKMRDTNDVAGIVFLRGKNDNECIGKSEIPNGCYDMLNVMFSGKITGDKAEVFRSDILKEYRFPEYEDEKFLGEDYIWRQIYLKYKMLYCNRIIYLCEYLEGGLTKQGRKLRISCPLGGMDNSRVSFDKRFPLKERIKRAWLYVCYGKFAGMDYNSILKSSGNAGLIRKNYIQGYILYLYWKAKYQ